MRRAALIKVVAISIVGLVLLSAVELFLRFQWFVKLDGFHNEVPWNATLHHGNGEFVVTEYGSSCNGEKIKMLLLGDSWMEDPILSRTIGQEFANQSKKCVQAINGGTNSYSPTLYLLKSRQAFKAYGKFDYIIVNIDETDIGDECLRYKIPLARNTTGQIVAVPFDRDLHSKFLWNGKLWAENSDFYIVRLIKFSFFYKALVPMLYELTFCPDYLSMMQYVFAPEAKSLHTKEHKYFEDRLMEMAEEMVPFTTRPGSVVVTHHPHQRGLVDRIDSGHLYLPVVSEAIARLEEKIGVRALDARKHIGKIHGESLLNNTFQENDPFSHLTEKGATRYGKWIASQIDQANK